MTARPAETFPAWTDGNDADPFPVDDPGSPMDRTEGQRAIAAIARQVALAQGDKIQALRESALEVRRRFDVGELLVSLPDLADQIWTVAETHGLRFAPSGEAGISAIEREATYPPMPDEAEGNDRAKGKKADGGSKSPPLLKTVTPTDWKGTTTPAKSWLVQNRIPAGDLTVILADGGSGKTEISVQLLISVSHDLGDWLGAVVYKAGRCLFLSAEEEEDDIRARVDRICKQRHIDYPYANGDLHLHFPDLESALLVEPDRTGKLIKTELFHSMVQWIDTHRPVLVVIDANAAVFGGNNVDRGQVRPFIAMLRKLGRTYGTTFVLLDHPSQRGMSDGSGTSGSVDWNNGPRGRIYIKPVKEDRDARILEVMKVNGSRAGETVNLRWNGLTFVPEKLLGEASPQRAAAERSVDDLFLQLLDKRARQGRRVYPSKGRGYAPSEFEKDPDAKDVKAKAFDAAMERLFTSGKIVVVETGPASKRVTSIVRSGGGDA